MRAGGKERSIFWPSPENLVQRLEGISSPGALCFELAPTGRIHPGILRTLAFAERIQQTFLTFGKSIEFVVRVNDLAPEKGASISQYSIGRRIAASVPSNVREESTALQSLICELSVLYDRIGYLRPKIILMTELYAKSGFRESLNCVYNNRVEIHRILSKYKNGRTDIFYPICPECHRIHSVDFDDIQQGRECMCACRACGNVFLFDALESIALVSFKVELALVWNALNACIDLHGQDHIEAYGVSTEIFHAIGYSSPPLPARVNLTFNSDGQKISKSECNFPPVLDMNDVDLEELLGIIDSTIWWKPMRLRGWRGANE